MGLRTFDRQNIFFEKPDHRKDENNGSHQTQQKNTDPDILGEQLIE